MQINCIVPLSPGPCTWNILTTMLGKQQHSTLWLNVGRPQRWALAHLRSTWKMMILTQGERGGSQCRFCIKHPIFVTHFLYQPWALLAVLYKEEKRGSESWRTSSKVARKTQLKRGWFGNQIRVTVCAPSWWLVVWDRVSLTFCPGWPQTKMLSIPTSQVSEIIGMSHNAQKIFWLLKRIWIFMRRIPILKEL
jgi:hypothetical protein